MLERVMGRGSLVLTAMVLLGCDARSLEPDAGGTDSVGSCGSDPMIETSPQLKLSDFEDLAAATIVQTGTPTRNGYWYTYNDGSDTCLQRPSPSPGGYPLGSYVSEAPPTPSPGPSGSLALHARWVDCDAWGAGIEADINVPLSPIGGNYSGPKVPYDLSSYSGITFWAMATPGSDGELRLKVPMTDETVIAEGGDCNESALHKCSDNFGEYFTLPAGGCWKQVTVRFSDPAFVQEGWGAEYAWNPVHAASIKIESRNGNMGQGYDFWIDDIYLFR
jgi:hypothetical protein